MDTPGERNPTTTTDGTIRNRRSSYASGRRRDQQKGLKETASKAETSYLSNVPNETLTSETEETLPV